MDVGASQIMKIRFDLIGVIVLSILYYFVLIFDYGSIFHRVLGMFVILFLPGYSMINAVYKLSKERANYLLIVALSFGTSIAIVTVLGMTSNSIGITMSAPIQGLFILAFNSLFAILGLIRNPKLKNIRSSEFIFVFSCILVAVIVLGITTAFSIGGDPEEYISLAIKDPMANSGIVRNNIQVNEKLEFEVSVDYLGNKTRHFKLVSSIGDKFEFWLEPGETWKSIISTSFTQIGRQNIALQLFDAEDNSELRFVNINADVK